MLIAACVLVPLAMIGLIVWFIRRPPVKTLDMPEYDHGQSALTDSMREEKGAYAASRTSLSEREGMLIFGPKAWLRLKKKKRLA